MAIRSNLLMTALVPMLVLLLTVLSPIIAGPIPETNLNGAKAPAVPVIAARYHKYSYPNSTTTAPPVRTGTA